MGNPNRLLKLAVMVLCGVAFLAPGDISWGDGEFYVVGGGSPWKRNGDNIYFTGGNVGIGKNNPAYPLDIRDFGSTPTHQYTLSVESDSPWTIFGNNWNNSANSIGVYGGTHSQESGACGVWGCVSSAPSNA